MTFEEWWNAAKHNYSSNDADSLKEDFRSCWEAGYKEGKEDYIYYHYPNE